MRAFYWYSAGVVALFFLVVIAAMVYTASRASSVPAADNNGLITLLALGGPAVAIWFIALGWVVAIFWRKLRLHDPALSQATFVVAIVVALLVAKAPFDLYRTFGPRSGATDTTPR